MSVIVIVRRHRRCRRRCHRPSSVVSIGCLMLLFIVIVLCLLAVVMLLGSWARLALLGDACQHRLHFVRIRGGFTHVASCLQPCLLGLRMVSLGTACSFKRCLPTSIAYISDSGCGVFSVGTASSFEPALAAYFAYCSDVG